MEKELVFRLKHYFQFYTFSQLARYTNKMVKECTFLVNQERDEISKMVANGSVSLTDGTKYLEALRWVERVDSHIYRIDKHIEEAVIRAGI